MWKTIRELPLTLLRVFSDGLERGFSVLTSPLRGRDEDEDDRPRRRWWSWFWLFPFLAVYWLFWGSLAALTFPVRAWFLPKPLRNCYFRGLPAFGLILAIALMIAAHIYLRERLVDRYRSRMSVKQGASEFSDAMLFAKRLVSNPSNLKREYVYFYGIAAAQDNQMDVANVAMSSIAPDGEIGFSYAHTFLALQLLRELSPSSTEEDFEAIRWHLEQSGAREDERSLVMWAKLYQAQAEWDKAAEALEEAGRKNPINYLALAELEENRAHPKAKNEALEKARQGFEKWLEREPLNKFVRLQHAMTLTRLERFQDAAQVLESAVQLHPEDDMRRAAAELSLVPFDALPLDAPSTARLSYLVRAMRYDLRFPEIYKRLTSLFDPHLSDSQLSEIRDAMKQLLVTGSDPSVAHFALGFVAGLRQDTRAQAPWHLAQASSRQPAIAAAYNNVAQVLMLVDPPRLDEAETFARSAATGVIQAPGFYVTLGRVLAAKKEWNQAIEVLVPLTEKFPESKEIHSLLATAYEAIGDLEKAATHGGLSQGTDQPITADKR